MGAPTWSKFWWTDWRADRNLRVCSIAARGLWMELLCLMADNPNAEYGVLKIGGRIPSAREIGVLTGVSTRLVSNLIAELVENNVCSTMPDGALYSRRMVREKEAFEGAADHGRKGGNPVLARGAVAKDERVRPFRKTDSEAKTMAVFQKTSGCCHWCGVALQTDAPGPDYFLVSHVVPIRDGGTNDLDNLVPSCTTCNQMRARQYRPTVTPPLIVGGHTDTNPQEARSGSLGESNGGTKGSTYTTNLGSTPRARDPLNTGLVGITPGPDGRPHCAGWDLDALLNRFTRLAKMPDPAATGLTYAPIPDWLLAGYDPDQIAALIERVAGRAGFKPPRSLAYFTAAVQRDLRPGAVFGG